MTPLPVIIDCDPGVDDAIALLLAFEAPELDVLAVTTVAGNVDVARTARNARLIRRIAARPDVPVFAGCARPMVRAAVDAGHFHGTSGLGSLPLFDPGAPADDGHAVTAIVDAVMRRPAGSVTVVTMGPMTNLAMAMILEPTLASRLARVVTMGGARSEGGNITASAEFNVFADPHAAHVVFGSGCPAVVIGLDATHQLRMTDRRIAAIEALRSDAARTAAELMRFSQQVERDLVGGDAAPLHDPCTIAWLLAPELFALRPASITVETASPLTLGHTAVEFRVGGARPANAQWATHVDADGVFAMLRDRLARA